MCSVCVYNHTKQCSDVTETSEHAMVSNEIMMPCAFCSIDVSISCSGTVREKNIDDVHWRHARQLPTNQVGGCVFVCGYSGNHLPGCWCLFRWYSPTRCQSARMAIDTALVAVSQCLTYYDVCMIRTIGACGPMQQSLLSNCLHCMATPDDDKVVDGLQHSIIAWHALQNTQLYGRMLDASAININEHTQTN